MTRVFSAVLFDLDGTLVDNMRIHLQAWAELAQELGTVITAERFERELAGRKSDETLALLLGRPVDADEVRRLSSKKEARYRELFAPQLALLPGTLSVLESLKVRGIKMAIASAAPRDNRDFVLGGLGIQHFFEAVIGAESVTRGKPSPDLFLAAAKAISVDPQRCLVFEDAVNGVKAGVAAGMATAAVTTTTSAEELVEAGAEWTARDFAQLPTSLLRSLQLAPNVG